ncbi:MULTISPECIES: LpqB family beta-propeller domain-containing protein [unclassified Phycicoccus]|uniref:LpqB family beta-propeller domain-containing protein n=1 Tax=unclassified Phycicoccus TaxID=2637926 RepID=UPI0009E79145|nr:MULTISPECIES: LpqB family beta-propeller domain-containing protein [unclassified Phycicoccus]
MRRRYAATLATGAVLAVTACGGLSTSSAIQPGLEVGSVQENEVRVEVNPVAPGSSPQQVVQGFIRAAAASDDSYQVARSYLASGPQSTWRPDSSVVVFGSDSEVTYKPSNDDTVTAVAKAIARIDGAGRYQELSPRSRVQVTFRLERTGGEWRISQMPDNFGTWLSQADLDRLYDPFRIYYVSAGDHRLVPDIRWLPLGTGLATRLARSLLAGVPDYLKGAVRTDIPAGTKLAVDAVTVASGTAKVDLSATKLGNDPGQRQNLGAQFLATVTQAPGVERVALQLEGADLQMPNGDSTVDSLSLLGFPTPSDPLVKPVLRVGTTLVAVDPDDVGDNGQRPPPPQAASFPTVQPGWAYLAMSRNGQEIAAVGGDRAQLIRWRGTTQVQLTAPGTMLTHPTYDREDVLWVAGRANGATRVWVVNAAADPGDASKSTPQTVSADWLSGRTVVSLRLSPDGQRVAVVTTDRDGSSPRVDVAGVVRQPNGLPASLSTPLRLAPTLSLARDLVWVDDATVAVLGRLTSSQVIRPWLVPLGGPIAAGPEIAGARTITTVNGERGLVVTTDDHEVLIRAGSRWQRVGEGTDLLVAAR